MSRAIKLRRRTALALVGAGPLAVGLGACSARSPVASRGWSQVLAAGTYLPVRTDWKHSAASEAIAVFSDMWAQTSGAPYRMVVGIPSALSSADAMMAEADSALRAALPGYRVTTEEGATERSKMTVHFKDFATDAEFARMGRLWILHNGVSAAAVALMASDLSESYRSVVDEGLSLLDPSGVPAAPDGWGRVGRDGTALAVPSTWSIVGAVAGSKRWREGWADADLDGATRTRVLLAPDTGKSSATDALAQIEADSIAGSLKGYTRRGAPQPLKLGQEGVSGVRVDFTYGSSAAEGTLWVVQAKERVSAIQVAFSGRADNDIVARMEKSIWVTDMK